MRLLGFLRNHLDTQHLIQNTDKEFNSTDSSTGVYSDDEYSEHEPISSHLASYFPENIPSDCSTPAEEVLSSIHIWKIENISSDSEIQALTSTKKKKKLSKTVANRSQTPMKVALQKKLFESEYAQSYEY